MTHTLITVLRHFRRDELIAFKSAPVLTDHQLFPLVPSCIDPHLKVTMAGQKTRTSATPAARALAPKKGGVKKSQAPEPKESSITPRPGLRSHVPSRAHSAPAVPIVPRVRAGSTTAKPWAPAPPRTPQPPPRGGNSSSDPSSDSESDSNHSQGTHMDDIQRTIENSIAAAFATRDGQGLVADTGTIPPFFTSPSAMPQNVLSRWPWVPEDIVKSIATGNFDIDNLPKLHRSEDLRNAYLKRSMKGGGIYQPLDGGAIEIVAGTSKLQSSFRDSTTFLLAWQVYTSIRTEFKPEMGTRLAHWTERLLYFVHLNYPWSSILSYIIAYYQTYQDRVDPKAWFQPDPTLMQYHLTLVQQSKSANIPSTSASAATIAAPRTPARRTELSSAKLEAMSVEVCQNFNRINGCRWGSYHNGAKCPRRHDCTICLGSGHNALNCPRKKSASHT
jgi:hypothetical protein